MRRVAKKLEKAFQRLQNHLLCVGAAALDLGAFTGFLYGFNEREFIYDIMDDDLVQQTAKQLADAIITMQPIYERIAKKLR